MFVVPGTGTGTGTSGGNFCVFDKEEKNFIKEEVTTISTGTTNKSASCFP